MNSLNLARITLPHAAKRSEAWADERLVKECLNGDQEAWSALVRKYERLIYSIPIRYGLSHADASDIFQKVCVLLLSKLETLRDSKSLAAWLIRTTSHESYHWIWHERRYVPTDPVPDGLASGPEISEEAVRRIEQEQILREALSQIPHRCRELIQMLFFENPAVPYDEAAKRLGLAKGSIGFVRMRCLKKLREQLEAKGFV